MTCVASFMPDGPTYKGRWVNQYMLHKLIFLQSINPSSVSVSVIRRVHSLLSLFNLRCLLRGSFNFKVICVFVIFNSLNSNFSDVNDNTFFDYQLLSLWWQMIDDQDLGFFANFLGIFIFVLVIAYHFVVADPKYEGNWWFSFLICISPVFSLNYGLGSWDISGIFI